MSAGPPPPPPPPSRGERFHAGRFVVGALLALAGVAWLLEVTGAWRVPWKIVLPIVLIVIGAGSVLSARTGRGQGALVALGIVLTLVLAVGTVVDIPFEGGIGDRTERPRTLMGLRGAYRLAVGKLTLDLTDLPTAPASTAPRTVEARVGMGQLTVVVPRPVLPDVHARVGVGSARVFGRERSGIDVRNDWVPFTPSSGPYTLDLSVGVGDIEVRYG